MHSPDLIPIEDVYAHVDRNLSACGCKTFDKYQKALLTELQSVSVNYLQKLVQSMGKRVATARERGGGKTKY